MTIETRPARAADIENLARFWHDHMDRRPGMARWRTIANCPWYGDPPNHGWVAVDGGRIVGAMALIHSTRDVRGQTERLCNIGSLYVLSAYRGRGLARAIARESTADESITYFGIDAAPQTRAVLEPDPVKFRILDDRRYTWQPGGGHERSRHAIRADDEFDSGALPASLRRMFDDHVALGMVPVSLTAEDGECHALLRVRNKDSDTLYYEAFFVSDAEVFAARAPDLADCLLAGRDAVLAADARFFDAPPPDAGVERLRQARHYKSARLSPAEIDLLYSEVPLLDLKIS